MTDQETPFTHTFLESKLHERLDAALNFISRLSRSHGRFISAEIAADGPRVALKLARSELKENNAENALAIIHSALEQEAKNAEAHRLREEAEKKFVAQVYQGRIVATRGP